MNIKFTVCLVSLLIIVSNAFGAERAQLKIGADEWPGYTNKDGTGIYFELVKAIYQDDFQLSFHTQTFGQTIQAFARGEFDIIVGMYSDDIEHAFYPQWFIDTEYPVVAIYDPKNTTINRASDFLTLAIGWLEGYRFDRFLSHSKSKILVGNINDGFKMLANHQLDAYLDYPYNLTEQEQKIYKTYPVLPARHVYLAFQHNHQGNLLAKNFDRNMPLLRSSGTLKQLYGAEYPHTGFEAFNKEKQKITIYTNPVSLLKARDLRSANSAESNTMNLNFIFDQLDDFRFEFKQITDLSAMFNTDRQSNSCFADLIKTKEREQQFLVSRPFSLFLGLRLYSTEQLAENSPIDLQALLNSNIKYRLGTVSGRSYGESIDRQLAEVKDQQVIKSPTNLESMFKQLEKQRFNLLIDYPSVKAKNWPSTKPLYGYEIIGADPFILGHLMCHKTTVNQQFINQLNLTILDLYPSSVFFDVQYRLVVDSDQQDFIRFFNQAFSE